MDRRQQTGFTLIELMVVVAIIGILAAIAIPNFMKFQGRSRQSEAKSNLKAMFTAEKAYYQANNTYSPYVNVIGFTPERGNRYSYDLGGALWQDRTTSIASSDPAETGIEIDTFKWGSIGLTPVRPAVFQASVVMGSAGSFYGTASGNVDLDTTLDQWSISDQQRPQGSPSSTTACAMDNNPGGEPCNDWTDI